MCGAAMFLNPVAMDIGVEMLFAGAHQANQCLIVGILMTRGPKNHFRQNRREINAFGREGVNQLSAVGRIAASGDDSVLFQAPQAIRQYIGRDFFVRRQKLVEGLIAAEHHVAQDEQRPAVAEHFNRGIERASGTTLRPGPLFRHFITVTHFHLHGASKIARLFAGNSVSHGPSLIKKPVLRSREIA